MKTFTDTVIDEISGYYNTESISNARIMEILKLNDFTVNSKLYALLNYNEGEIEKRIDPPLAGDIYYEFGLAFTLESIRRHSNNCEFIDFVSFFWFLFNEYPEKIRKWVDVLHFEYENAGSNRYLKDIIADGILEHLFERSELRELFSDWSKDSNKEIVEVYKKSLDRGKFFAESTGGFFELWIKKRYD